MKKHTVKAQLPSSFAENLGLEYTKTVTSHRKKKYGQYFTPLEIANFMSQFSRNIGQKVRILDPGCGLGILSCTLIENLISKNPDLKEIDLTAFEKDLELVEYTEKSLEYLREWLVEQSISLNYFLCTNDFILHNSAILRQNGESDEKFDIVISNPPYFKIKKDDPINLAIKGIAHGQQNIYSIFIIVSLKLLVEGGQLIFISPRSFASGSYFRVFRELFFTFLNIDTIHLFNSRKDAFQRDNVLQENVIVVGRKKEMVGVNQLLLPFATNSRIDVSLSQGIADLSSRKTKSYKIEDLVNFSSYQKNLHLPTSKEDDVVIKLFKKWNNTLTKSGISISTGPVVAFRAQKFLFMDSDSVPLIWLNNVNNMKFEWPISKLTKKKSKSQYICKNSESTPILIPNLDYVFLRRFSSKDDKSKLVASPYFSEILKDFEFIGVENHLNYIYRKDGVLSKEEVIGISSLLNSRLFDVYFRTFNGNINVSATELKDMPIPQIRVIKLIGKRVIEGENYSQTNIDTILEEIFRIKLTN